MAVLHLETPDLITEWNVNSFCVSSEEGFGMSPPSSIRVIQPFYLEFTPPYSIKEGELIPLKISVYNLFNYSIPV
jgi:hypothetical protein